MCLQKQASPKKYQTFLLGTRGLRAGMSAGLKKFMWVATTQQKTLLYKGSTCADCICSEKACLLQPLLASGICYYSEAAIYPFPHSTHGPVNWQGPAFWLPVPTMSSQYRKFMFMCFFALDLLHQDQQDHPWSTAGHQGQYCDHLPSCPYRRPSS